MLNNNFSYIQLSFIFLPQKDSYSDLDDIDTIGTIDNIDDIDDLLQKEFYTCCKPFFVFFLFLLQKGFGTFPVLLLEAFLCFFLIIFINHFYISTQKIMKNVNSY